ncbi:MAG: hypothetical protein U0165_03450 [Polyangiaceae bacterium]
MSLPVRLSSFIALALSPLVLALGCREKPVPIAYLGVVDAGTYSPDGDYVPLDGGTDSNTPDTSIVAPPLTATACSSSITLDGNPLEAVAGISALPDADAIVIGNQDGIDLHALDSDGCPVSDSAFQSLGVGRITSVQALAGGVTLFSGTSGAGRVISSGSGNSICVTCAVSGRSILATSTTNAFVASGGSSIQKLSFNDTDSVCDAAAFAVVDAPLVLAASAQANVAWVGSLSVSSDSTVPSIKKLALDTGAVDTSVNIAASQALCGIDAMLELGGKLYVVDSGCRRVVAFNATTGATVAVHETPESIPRGLTVLQNGDLLLASAADAGTRSTVTFAHLTP